MGQPDDVPRRTRVRRAGRCLVTGGAGFIGSHLVDHLLAGGHRVTVLDDLSASTRDNLPLHHPALRMVEGHVGDAPHLFDQLVREADLVCHLAGPTGARHTQQQPFGTTDSIVRAGLEVTRACADWRRPLLFLSSSEVYGAGPVHASETDDLRLGTQTCFSHAAATLAVEHLVLGLHRSFGLPSWVVRPFNVVGPRQSPTSGHVVPSFLQAALRGTDVVVHGDGTQRRTFLHVADFVAGLDAVLGAPALVGRPVNVGGHESCSIVDLAALVVRTVGSPVRVRHVGHEEVFGSPVVDPWDKCGSVDLLASETGWAPARTLVGAVLEAGEWLRPRVAAGGSLTARRPGPPLPATV